MGTLTSWSCARVGKINCKSRGGGLDLGGANESWGNIINWLHRKETDEGKEGVLICESKVSVKAVQKNRNEEEQGEDGKINSTNKRSILDTDSPQKSRWQEPLGVGNTAAGSEGWEVWTLTRTLVTQVTQGMLLHHHHGSSMLSLITTSKCPSWFL